MHAIFGLLLCKPARPSYGNDRLATKVSSNRPTRTVPSIEIEAIGRKPIRLPDSRTSGQHATPRMNTNSHLIVVGPLIASAIAKPYGSSTNTIQNNRMDATRTASNGLANASGMVPTAQVIDRKFHPPSLFCTYSPFKKSIQRVKSREIVTIAVYLDASDRHVST